MNSKIAKLKVCDWTLLSLTVIMLASSIQLEVTGGKDPLWVWAHIVTGTLFFTGILWHCYLHFGMHDWIRRLRKRYIWISLFFLLTFMSAAIATGHWLTVATHSMPGAVHGKIGFVFIAIVTGHIIHRIRFYKQKQ